MTLINAVYKWVQTDKVTLNWISIGLLMVLGSNKLSVTKINKEEKLKVCYAFWKWEVIDYK